MKKNLLIIACTVVLIIVVERLISLTGVFQSLELMTYDARTKIALDNGPFSNFFKPADKDIVLVSIDDYSRKELAKHPQLGLGSFPWQRGVWADVVNFIEQGKPKAILFDIIFNELNENPANDRKLANEIGKYDNIVLATSLNDPEYLVRRLKDKSQIQNSNYIPTKKSLDVYVEDDNLDDAITYYSHAPIHSIYTRNATMAVVNKVVGTDSVIRNAQPIFKLMKNGEVFYIPSLSFAGFLKAVGEDGKITIKNNNLYYKDRIIPINNNGETAIGWHGTGKNYRYIPISKIFLSKAGIHKNTVKPDVFKDKIVVIGRTEAGTDIHTSAVNPTFAGPEANAVALDNFINDSRINTKGTRKFITRLNPITSFAIGALGCIILVYIGFICKNATYSFLNSACFLILYILICILAFTAPNIRLWIPLATPLYYFIITSILVFTYRFQKELAKKATIMNMFGKFVSPKVLTQLMKNQDNLELKSSKKRITVMFCDVKNFTTLSEKSNPEQLVSNLNELLDVIVNVIFENNGTVDKFIGDCVMAYWGDPFASEDDAYMAVKTALDIKKRVGELAVKNAKEGKIIFDVKIGINTGDALLGLSGSQKIMSYTAMGDAVNVSSRLESNCNKVGKDILISKSTYEDAKDKIVVLEAGRISVKGRNEEIDIYEPIGIKEEINNENE